MGKKQGRIKKNLKKRVTISLKMGQKIYIKPREKSRKKPMNEKEYT